MRNTLKISIFLSCLLATLQSYAETDVKQVVSFNNMILLDGVDLNKGFIYPSTGGKQIKEIIAYPYYYHEIGPLADNFLATNAVKTINDKVIANHELITTKLQGITSYFSEDEDMSKIAAQALPVVAVIGMQQLVKQESVFKQSELDDINKTGLLGVSEYKFDKSGLITFYRTRYEPPFKNDEMVFKKISQLPSKDWINFEKNNSREYCSIFKVNHENGLIDREVEIDCSSYQELEKVIYYIVKDNVLYQNHLGRGFRERLPQIHSGRSLEFDDQHHLTKLTYGGGFKEDGTIDCYFSEINEQGDWTKRSCGRRLFTTHNYDTKIPSDLYRKIEYYDNE